MSAKPLNVSDEQAARLGRVLVKVAGMGARDLGHIEAQIAMLERAAVPDPQAKTSEPSSRDILESMVQIGGR